jgi:hypothetical protein
MRPAAALVVVVSCALLAGCGSSKSSPTAGGAGKTLEELWNTPGEKVAIVPGDENHEPGRNRVSFLVVDSSGRVVTQPTATVWVATSRDAEPFVRTTAALHRIGVVGGAEADATAFYAVHVDLPEPHTYWLVAEPVGGAKIQAIGNVSVVENDPPPDVGDKAFPSKTPTIASMHGDLPELTTRTPPDVSLLRYSIADSLKAHVPFVVTFATPKFCQSRLCGPSVDVTLAAQRRFRRDGIRFIHVEVYEDNDVAKGYNRWMREWKLESEPWTFLVDRRGRIADRFEGALSVDELEGAIRAKLLS